MQEWNERGRDVEGKREKEQNDNEKEGKKGWKRGRLKTSNLACLFLYVKYFLINNSYSNLYPTFTILNTSFFEYLLTFG